MKKILVTGANGQLGQAAAECFSTRFKLYLTDLVASNSDSQIITQMDITDEVSVSKTISRFNPDILLHLASFTDVDGCERNPSIAEKINVFGTENLLKHFSGYIVFISTDYVFDGESGPYSETDNPNPINVYGQTKLAGESLVIESPNPSCIIRTNVVFDYTKNTEASFVKWVVDSLSKGTSIQVVNDQWNNPTWTVELAKAIADIVDKNLIGLWNYAGADYINRLDFAQMIADEFNLDGSLISAITTDELDQPASRPLLGGLITEKIEAAGIYPMQLQESLAKINKRISV